MRRERIPTDFSELWSGRKRADRLKTGDSLSSPSGVLMDKKSEKVPFFAKKANGEEIVVKTGVRAGASESRVKLKEEQAKGL